MNSEQTQTTSTSRSLELLAWAEVNKKKLLYGVAGAAALGLLAFFYSHHKAQQELDAGTEVVQLGRTVDASGRIVPPGASAYLKLAQTHSGTAAGERALLLAAGGYFTGGQFGEAKNTFEQFTREFPNSRFAATAAFGLAASLDGSGDTDKALAAYETVVSSHATDPIAQQAKVAMGVLYEAKRQPEKALKLYEEVIKAKNSSWGTEAEMRKERLQAQMAAPKFSAPMAPPTGLLAPAAPTPAPANVKIAPAPATPPVKAPAPANKK
ncbi:MAG: tetratricopeptide repeat protein [Verrucomicrobia bacterium]|nr:tetratricopeptide repeat protein [Verrucomicrobiota bacterium]